MDEPDDQIQGSQPDAHDEPSVPLSAGVESASAAVPESSPLASDEQPLELPRWVAPAIGAALVAIAAMAVWTGFRPRVRTEPRYVITEPRVPAGAMPLPKDSGGAPGDPGPGASMVVQSETGGAVPLAEPIPEGELPRSSISGDAAGVVPTTSFEVRRGIAFESDRADAMVYVNDLPMGEAGQFASKGQAYEFSQEGSFTVRVVAKDGTEARYTVVASAGAELDVAVIRVRLAKP